MSDLDKYKTFLQIHQFQLTSSSVPTLYWPALYYKLVNEVYDAGAVFQMQQVVSGEDDENMEWRVVVSSEEGLDENDAQHIYLIDHAWTYQSSEARASLQQVPGLLERMASLMGVKGTGEQLLDGVLETMWKFNQTYRFGHNGLMSEDTLPMWYITDEFGSRIQHSDEPTVRVVPFFFTEANMAFSLMWPVRSLEGGDEITRDYCESVSDPIMRSARLMPWVNEDLRHLDFSNIQPDKDYFWNFANKETLPSENFEFPGLPKDRSIRVYLEFDAYKKHLTDPKFELTDDPKSADVLWYSGHFYDFRGLSEGQPATLVNQFPREMVLTVKDLLAITARHAAKKGQDPMKDNPRWLPVTYNLQTELPQFVSYFQHRQDRGLDNHWICKPWNLARALDTYVSKDLTQIVRLPDVGPKVACKYLENPVLYHREELGCKVKFDLRYLVVLSRVQPLKVYVHRVFYTRFANKAFSLDHLDEYEKHFTVMNYKSDAKLKNLLYDEFIKEFESQYPSYPWTDVENDIFVMLRELFEAATMHPPPKGLAHSPQSRALYAVDLMLAWDVDDSGERCIVPKLCEVNFAPDCHRACNFDPNFINEMFSIMFLDEVENKQITPLCDVAA